MSPFEKKPPYNVSDPETLALAEEMAERVRRDPPPEHTIGAVRVVRIRGGVTIAEERVQVFLDKDE